MRLGLALILLLLAVPPEAIARTHPRFTQLVKQAERLYSTGKYKDSAEKLIEAYVYDPHPRLIYNIARAYDQAGELELALEFYQRYVKSREGTDPTLLKRSALSIDRVRELMKRREETKQREAQLSAEAKAAEERAAREAEAKRRAEGELRLREAATAEEQVKARGRARIAAYTLGGVAVAGLGTGAIFGLQSNGSRNQFRDAKTVAAKSELEARTRQQALIADIGFGVGLVAAVTAVILYPKGPDEAAVKSSTEVVSVLVGPNSAGLEVKF
ncbi:MAG: hypothetical protein WBV82_24910 [Myxococcaceae bacterium]